MKRTLTWIIASSFLSSGFAGAQAVEFEVLSPSAKLRRMSLIVRDQIPAHEEFWQVKKLGHQSAGYLRSKANEYLNSANANKKLVEHMSALFAVRAPGDSYNENSSLHSLFQRIAEKNLPWDELLTSSTIVLTQKNAQRNFGSPLIYKNQIPQQHLQEFERYFGDGQMKRVRSTIRYSELDSVEDDMFLNVDAPQIAGVFSDPHFISRFKNTPVNQNRKRAAAIFRIFLCDEMRAVILPDSNGQKEIDDAGLDPEQGASASNSGPANLIAQHANDPKCSTCHYKLDPLANVFRGVNTRLPVKPVPGSLTYKRKNGELVSVNFNNAQELARALIRQPEYVSCQVNHFWNWYIGSDVVMDKETEDDLMQKFEEVGRRPKDFIEILLNRKEFYSYPKLNTENISFRYVSKVLKDCNSCHDGEPTSPDLGKLPFSYFANAGKHGEVLDKMVTALDLLGDGSKATMPPKTAGWKISSDDRARLLTWLSLGAPDDQGRPTWSNTSVQSRLRQRVTDEKITFQLRPTFGWTFKRRLSMDQFQEAIKILNDELKSDTDFTNAFSTDRQNAAFRMRDLETGVALTNPNSSYMEIVKRLVGQLQPSKIPLNQDHLLDYALDMSERIWGEAPAAGSENYKRLDALVQHISREHPENFKRKVVQQLIYATPFMTY